MREEARIIEAYRDEILSPSQLGEELEKIKARRAFLESRKEKLAEEGSPDAASNVRRSAVDYCRMVASRLNALTTEERQRFLRLVIDRVIFEGVRVRIKGIIPLNQGDKVGDGEERRGGENIFERFGDNVAATSPCYGRNVSARNSEYLPPSVLKIHTGLRFELTRDMPAKGFSVLSAEGLALVRRLAERQHDPTLRELCEQVLAERGIQVSVYQMSRALRRLGMSPTRRGPRPKRLSRAAEGRLAISPDDRKAA